MTETRTYEWLGGEEKCECAGLYILYPEGKLLQARVVARPRDPTRVPLVMRARANFLLSSHPPCPSSESI